MKSKNQPKSYIDKLSAKGYEVLYDDRDDISPGVKFKDANLLGVPLQLVVSEKNMKNDEIEVKIRRTGEREKVKYEDIFNRLPILLENL